MNFFAHIFVIYLFLQVNVMIVSSVISHVATVIVLIYAGVTLSYGEEDDELFHPRHITEVVQPSLCHAGSALCILYTAEVE